MSEKAFFDRINKKKILLYFSILSIIISLSILFYIRLSHNTSNDTNLLIPAGYSESDFIYDTKNSAVKFQLTPEEKYRVISNFFDKFKPNITLGEYISKVGSPTQIIGSGVMYYQFDTPEGTVSVRVANGDALVPEDETIIYFDFYAKKAITNNYFSQDQEKVLTMSNIADLKIGLNMQDAVKFLGKPSIKNTSSDHIFIYEIENGGQLTLTFLSESHLEAAMIHGLDNTDKFGTYINLK